MKKKCCRKPTGRPTTTQESKWFSFLLPEGHKEAIIHMVRASNKSRAEGAVETYQEQRASTQIKSRGRQHKSRAEEPGREMQKQSVATQR